MSIRRTFAVSLVVAAILIIACSSSGPPHPPPSSTPAPIATAVACPGTLLLAAVSALDSDTDCIDAIVTLRDGSVVVGTKEGNVGLVLDGMLREVHADGAMGPVSDLMAVPLVDPPIKVIREVVLFSVDQGIGIFDPRDTALIRLDNRTLRRGDGEVVESSPWIVDRYYVKMSPEVGRHRLHDGAPVGTYVLRKSDGQDEYLGIDIGAGFICGLYTPFPGAVPGRRYWCADASDIAPAPTVPARALTPLPTRTPRAG